MMNNCYNCDNLDPKKKSAGKLDGSLYYCKKLKTYVNAYRDGCEKWEKSDRKSYENDEFYEQGKKYYNDDKPLGFYLFLLVLVIIFCIILTLMQ